MKNTIGSYTFYTNQSRAEAIRLNGQYHANVKYFQRYVDDCIEIQWYPANATLHKTFVHEYGHYVSNSMRWITKDADWEKRFIQECIEDFKKIEPSYTANTYIGMKEYVSQYGASSASELFAEAFAEYFGGENPRAFAQLFGEKLEKLILEKVR